MPGDEDAIDIPGKGTRDVPPIRIPLPIQAGPNRLMLLLLGLLQMLFLALFLLPIAAFATVFWNSGSSLEPAGYIMAGLLIPACSLCIVWLFRPTIACLGDAFRRRPILIIDGNGLFDSRANIFLSWSLVATGKEIPTRTGIGGVHLYLRSAIGARQNPFGFSILGSPWRRPPDELFVATFGLDVRSDRLADVILALVRRAGTGG
jgi:hypothetical protein